MTFIGSIGVRSKYLDTAGMRPADVLEAFNVLSYGPEYDRIMALLKRPWVCATESDTQKIFDGEDC
ncbi:hypothetical protein [Sulfitobacter delicatus]|uniref:Uncharacterized protein n=1 Tax=Sulfitobacter delicatus TaxID=218672 RepID=A0A1G7XHX1_9RHOB|nr:hypothetical protein [Sulfitobacter delicatus]SDG83792.1 hypothetical protein SAMN04489759_112120 [Sulfitobacter delicatus]